MTAWHARARPRHRAALVVGGVLAMHLLLILLLNASGAWTAQRIAVPAAAQRVSLRLIPQPAPRAPRVDAKAAPASPEPRARPRATIRAPEREHRNETPIVASTPISPAEPAASGPDAPPSLLDTEATRRAIRASARAPSLDDQLARSREEPQRLSANDRLAIGVREAGKGDCAKGEYAGAGMGLLSLPFLALAVASDNCAK